MGKREKERERKRNEKKLKKNKDHPKKKLLGPFFKKKRALERKREKERMLCNLSLYSWATDRCVEENLRWTGGKNHLCGGSQGSLTAMHQSVTQRFLGRITYTVVPCERTDHVPKGSHKMVHLNSCIF